MMFERLRTWITQLRCKHDGKLLRQEWREGNVYHFVEICANCEKTVFHGRVTSFQLRTEEAIRCRR